MSLSKFSKKGQISNYIAIIIFLILFGFSSLFGYVFLDKYIEGYQNAGLYTGKVEETGNNFLNTLRSLDYIMVLFLIVLIIAVGVQSYRLAVSPAFYIIQMIMLPFYGFVSYFFNYLFSQMVSPSVFDGAKAYFQNTLIICTNLHWVMLATFIVGSVALYAKKEKGQFLG